MSIFGVVFAARYIPQAIFNALMILATFCAVFFVQSSSKASSHKKPQKKQSSWISSVREAIKNSILMLVCISLIGIVLYILSTSFWYNVINGTSFTSLFFVIFAGLCILLVILFINLRNFMNSILPYINILIVIFFIVMFVLQYNIAPGSAIYIPALIITFLSFLSLVYLIFVVAKHQYTTFGKAVSEEKSIPCKVLGIVLAAVVYILLVNLTYYFEGILDLLQHLINENTGPSMLAKYIGYNSWYGMSFRALIALFCLVNFMSKYDDLYARLFHREETNSIAYRTVVLGLAYYVVMLVLSYFWGISFRTIALFIPIHVLYLIAFYLEPFVRVVFEKVGWIYGIPLMILMMVVLVGALYLFLGDITLARVVFFIPSLYLRMIQAG